MKSKWTLLGSILAVLLLALAAGLTQAQGPEPPENAVTGESLAAPVPFGIPIQGRLTDASGNPISGGRVVTFTLYDSLDNQIWSSGPQAVTMDNNGLFSTVIAFAEPSLIDGRELRLGIQVAGDSVMSPHQIIYAVPYAWSLRPGAIISDTRSGAILSVQNYGSGSGVYGRSNTGSAVYGYSSNGVAIQAAGTGIIKSTAVSRVFVPGGEAVVGGTATSDVQLTYWGQGRVDVETTSNNVTRTIVIPIPLPAVLYGQQVRIADMRVYYRTSNSASYIAETDLYREQIGGTYYSLIQNTSPRNSTTDTYYHIYCTDTNCQLSDDEGFVSVRLQLYFNNSAHTITIGGVRVTLEHD
jgi:hypothetical protein